jgi:RHS repeat-associated protein
MAIVDASGDVEKGYTYDVYGEPTVTGSLGNEFDFAGQQTDPSTGLQYLRARYYDPQSGTFMSRDPMATGPAWLGSPTSYADGSPCVSSDPTGLAPSKKYCEKKWKALLQTVDRMYKRFTEYVQWYDINPMGRRGHLNSYQREQWGPKGKRDGGLRADLQSWDRSKCPPPPGGGGALGAMRTIAEYDIADRGNWGKVGSAFDDVYRFDRGGKPIWNWNWKWPDIQPPDNVWWTDLPPWWWPNWKVPEEN